LLSTLWRAEVGARMLGRKKTDALTAFVYYSRIIETSNAAQMFGALAQESRLAIVRHLIVYLLSFPLTRGRFQRPKRENIPDFP
jgi:hypothetical protein